jgi:hypothetical protein
MKSSLAEVAAVWQPSFGVTWMLVPNSEQPDHARVVLATVAVVPPPVAGVVPEIVALLQLNVGPPGLIVNTLLVDSSVNAVLAGSIVVADAEPAAQQVVIRATAQATSHFLGDVMTMTLRPNRTRSNAQ